MFLREAAVNFLKYTGKDTGNKLERDLLVKLLNPTEIAQLKADGLMYYHVYADLVMLSKLSDLQKSALDMNLHYLELKFFLQEVEHHPEVVMDKEYRVFRSEEKLYGQNKVSNHRLHLKSCIVHNKLFEEHEDNPTLIYSLLVAGAVKMQEKLCTYAGVREVLSELTPSNDLCESILGLNDYLTNAIPNLHQVARSNLVQLKKNKTMQWLHSLPDEQQIQVIDLAVESRQAVQKECKHEEQQRAIVRRQNMAQAHIRREVVKQKAQQERN